MSEVGTARYEEAHDADGICQVPEKETATDKRVEGCCRPEIHKAKERDHNIR